MRFPLLLAGVFVATGAIAPAYAFTPELSQLEAVPLHMVRAPLAKRIEAVAEKHRPYQFAVQAALPLGLADGAWDQVDAATARWRLRVASPGAESLNFEFARFRVPAGAQLWMYDVQGELVQGPYTSANITPEGKLWTPVVLGEQAVLELQVPWTLREQVQLELARVGHGFRGFGKDAAVPSKSGSCNVDVVCPLGDDWRDEIRSVARITIGGSLLCTGQLFNNLRQDDDPLFITANHCEIAQQDDTPASSVVFYWNFFNSTCREAAGTNNREGNGSLAQNQAGSSLLAGDVGSDFTLLRLNQAPSPTFNVYFAGWDAGNAIPQSGVTIHHPQGDEKSISRFDEPAERGFISIGLTRNVSGWGVTYAEGTTQQGSSGAGLWNQDHRIVGWLSGGDASCFIPEGEDFFGRMEVGWTAGPQPDEQLKAWLDPDNTGAKVLDGRNPETLGAVNDVVGVAANSGETLLNVLANDSGSGLTVIGVGTPSQGGSVAIRSNGTRVGYAPAANFSGTETFTYIVSDNDGEQDSATVTVTVTPPPAGGGGGGGAFGPALLGLLALALARRRLGRAKA